MQEHFDAITALAGGTVSLVALYAGLNMLLLMALGLNVSMNRRATQTSLGDGGHGKVTQAVRAHGNHAEWFPGFIAGLLIAALMGIPDYAIHSLGVAFTLGRVLHAWGMLTNAGASFGRLAGSLLTLISYLLLGAGLIVHAVV
jgi:uncharacterized membrane protein YecN with MAPEG domain